MPSVVPKVKLNDGFEMPVIGLGTYNADNIVEVIASAIDSGYRHFDCADIYGNEEEIGTALNSAISAGKVKREDLFVVTKVWCTWMARGRPTISAKRSLKRFGFDYLDLLLIHWPTPYKQDKDYYPLDSTGQLIFDDTINLADVWKEFEDIKKSGD
ncbi:unnamed protein product [Medioppia subpectinata]|uniref:NADP-dependent oxidoreductase domain-containing protein n=1 Tax=Medioppia subpectinata TaxID=1979941 RepID=A0A7R9LUA2_9ACAR|nr:unnamed protein product [Medioppia subpectinata]CAG2121212.1 unnamed protein product [Medioppia subpectinata]